jgi:hypothetical protein
MTAPARPAAVARGLLLLVALGLALWFVVLARDAAIGSGAAARVHSHPDMSASEWDHAMDDLRRAELLDPGTDWDVNRAAYLILRDRAAAARVAAGVVEREPDNLDAWVVLLKATQGRDERQAARARAEIRRLNPPPQAD